MPFDQFMAAFNGLIAAHAQQQPQGGVQQGMQWMGQPQQNMQAQQQLQQQPLGLHLPMFADALQAGLQALAAGMGGGGAAVGGAQAAAAAAAAGGQAGDGAAAGGVQQGEVAAMDAAAEADDMEV
jgi:hypothetical protein